MAVWNALSLVIYTTYIQDIIISGILALIFLVTGALAGRYSALWDEWVDVTDDSSDVYVTFVTILGALGAACVRK